MCVYNPLVFKPDDCMLNDATWDSVYSVYNKINDFYINTIILCFVIISLLCVALKA